MNTESNEAWPAPIAVRVVPEPEEFMFRAEADGELYAMAWPANALMSKDFLEWASPEYVREIRPGIWRFTLANGEADYLLGDFDVRWLARPARRIRLVER